MALLGAIFHSFCLAFIAGYFGRHQSPLVILTTPMSSMAVLAASLAVTGMMVRALSGACCRRSSVGS